MIKPYFKSNDKKFYLLKGDTIDLLPKIDHKFDMVFADPPYFLSNNGLSIQSGKIVSVNKGKWDKEPILSDTVYFNAMTHTSQNLNPSYGYLTWLNGQSSLVMPGSPLVFQTSLAVNAPSDLFAAMGKNGQFIDVVPSENIVVIRFGDAPDDSLVPAIFHNEMWEKIMDLIQ